MRAILAKKVVRIMKTWIIATSLFFYLSLTIWYQSINMGQTVRPSPRCPEQLLHQDQHQKESINVTMVNESLSSLADRNDFRFLINHEACGNDHVFLLVFIHSAPTHLDKRNSIRRTWAQRNLINHTHVRVIFLLGDVENDTLRNDIRAEDSRESDIIQGNFLDSYRNLTYKHLMGFKWIAQFCNQAQYVFKTDDDVFIDMFQLVTYLRASHGNGPHPPRNLMACYMYYKSYAKRSTRSKWYVPVSEYGEFYYPPYCAGFGIIMSVDVVTRIYSESAKIPFFWIDDVAVSGILAQRVGVQHVDLTDRIPLSHSWGQMLRRWLYGPSDADLPFVFVPQADVTTIYRLWNETLHYHYYNKVNR